MAASDHVRELARRTRQQSVVADLGERMLAADDPEPLLSDAVAAVGDALGVESCALLELAAGERLLVRAGTGLREGAIGAATVPAEGSPADVSAESADAVVFEEPRREHRPSDRESIVGDVESAIGAVVGPHDDPWGVLEAYATEGWPFTEADGDFLRSVANVLASALERERANRRTREGRALTEREEREQRLEQYRAVTEAANDVIVTIDAGSTIQSVNPAVADVFGYEPDELVGESLTTLMSDDMGARHRAAVARYLETGERALDWDSVEVPGRHADGSPIPLSITFSEIEYRGERYFTGVVRDVTERKQLEGERRETIETLQRLYEISADAEATFGEKVDRALELGGEFLDMRVGFLANVDEEADRFEVLHARGENDLIRPGNTSSLERTYCRRLLDADGVLALSNAGVEAWESDAYDVYGFDSYIGGEIRIDGQTHGTLCFCDERARDGEFTAAERTIVELVTQWISYELERVEHERSLEEYREYTDDVLDAVDDVFYVVDERGRFQRWNESLTAVTGYSDDEIASMSPLEFVVEEDREAIADGIATVLETGSDRVTVDVRTKDGDRIPYEFAASALETPSGERVLAGIGRDITERERYRRGLRRRIEQQEIVTYLGQRALETDDLDELMYEASRLVAEALGTDYCKVLDLDACKGELLLRQGVGWRDGIAGTATVAADENSQAGYTLLSEAPVVVEDLAAETRFAGPDLLTSHDVTSGISTIIGSVDDPWGILGIHDTDRRSFTDEDVVFVRSVANVLADAIERQEYQDALEETVEKLEESNERLEQFAYAASHDLQEPLRMVSSYLQLIERRYGDALDEDGEEFLAFAVDGADRMREMIDGLLTYSRVEKRGDPLEPVALSAVFEEATKDLEVKIRESNAKITTDSLPRVRGDASQLRQVFQNLLSNAIEYSGDEPPRVHVSAERSETRGGEWVVSVRDEGIGIDPADSERIFDVFQRLHTFDEGSNTGIGLALCERIVERHGGDIWVDSDPGEGATFSFTLPPAEVEHA